MIADEYEARLEWEDHTRLLPVDQSETREATYWRKATASYLAGRYLESDL